jgi:hypothetical protein
MDQPNLPQIVSNVDETVEDLWDKVLKHGDIVIRHAREFGFEGMHKPQPNIHQLVLFVGFLEGGVDALTAELDVTPEETRLLLNAKRVLGSIKMAAKALNRRSKEDFDFAMNDLKTVAPI